MSRLINFLKIASCIALLCFIVPIKISGPDNDPETKFKDYLIEFNKTYPNKTEYQLRLQAFQVGKSFFHNHHIELS